MVVVAVVQLPSHVQLFATPWTAACQASLSLTIPWSLPKFTSIESVMPSNCLILCHPHPPAFSLSQHQGLSNKLAVHIGWPKYWSFSFSISPSNEYSGLIFFFRIDWFDLLTVQWSLQSLLQHHSSKASILLCSAFCLVRRSYPYITTGKSNSNNNKIEQSQQYPAIKVMWMWSLRIPYCTNLIFFPS